MSLYGKCSRHNEGKLNSWDPEVVAHYTCGCSRRIEIVEIPDCSMDPEACGLCDIMRLIFEGFPSEEDPGCEVANAAVARNSN